jgi:hypothetical protein
MQRTVVDEFVCHAYGDANLLPDGAETEKIVLMTSISAAVMYRTTATWQNFMTVDVEERTRLNNTRNK